ncbi:MAG: TRAP transporter small permease [Paracoccaceae bacterium]
MEDSSQRNAWLTRFDWFLTFLAFSVGGTALVFMMILGVLNVVIMRKFLNAPITGAEDYLILTLVVLVAAAIPFGGRVGAHIEIEIFESKMSPAFDRWSMVFFRLLGALLMGAMANQLMDAGSKASKFGETTQQLLISYEAFYYFLAFCIGLYALVLLTDALLLIGGRTPGHILIGDEQ